LPVDVTTETTIDRPIEDVASYVADPSNAPEWYANIGSADWKTPPPLQRGSRIAFVARWMGRRLEYTYEVTDFVPNERLVMGTTQGPFPMETTYTWQALGGGQTRMTIRNRGEPRGFSKVARPVMAATIRRANEKDLEHLRSILEHRRAETERREGETNG
jgi:uncharacterized protein YndB with AHSA1/START domain